MSIKVLRELKSQYKLFKLGNPTEATLVYQTYLKGNRCDKCATNYYGNPTEKGGSCKMCECNGNTDLNDPSRSQFNVKNAATTDGEHCEKCLPGYYGDALIHQYIRKSLQIIMYFRKIELFKTKKSNQLIGSLFLANPLLWLINT